MKLAFFKVAALVLVVCLTGVGVVTNSQTPRKPATADVKIRQRMSTGGGNGIETLLYVKGQRMRTEMPGQMGFTTIVQCDLKRSLTINEKTKSYMVTSTDGTSGASAEGDGGGAATVSNAQPQNQQPQSQPPQTQTRGGIVNITNTITDTGERKEMFGFTARRIKTSLVKTASPEACDKDQKVETDGWYVDFQYAFECPSEIQKQPTPVIPQQPGCKDEIRTKTIGSAKLGFPLHLTTTVYQADGRTSTMTQEVLELSRETLSASLFDVPEGYTLAKNSNELYGISAAASAAYNPQPNNAPNTTPGNTPKKPGVIRIGIITPKVQLTSGNVAQTTESLRNSFVGQLNGPNIEVVTLSTIDEARQKQCDYVLSIAMNVKKGGGSMFGRALGNITGVYTSTAVSNSIKAKDEVSLEYKLDSVEPTRTVLSNSAKAKAKSDGDDVITPLVQTAAQSIVSTVAKQ